MADNYSNSTRGQSLAQIQRWMQSVITDPDGVENGVTSKRSQAEIPLTLERVEDVILPSQKMSSLDRLEIYANAYYARLIECLRDEFPATSDLLGEDTFNAFAFDYLQYYPSTSYTLAELGAHFPRHLRETCPKENPGAAPCWEDFLIELTTLERLYSEVFSATGPEVDNVLNTEEIAAVLSKQLDDLVFTPVPSLRLMHFEFPVHEYISSFRSKPMTEIPSAQETGRIVTRRDYIVRRASVSALEYQFLSSLIEGCSLGTTIQQTLAVTSEDEEKLATMLREWFQRWAASQYFQAIRQLD
jgi:hypothetical protein